MPPLRPSSRRLSLALACAMAVGVARAELIKVSPFLPPQSAGNAPTQNAPLEFRGTLEVDDVDQYRVVDPQRKVGTWLKVGERDANLDVVIKQHDEEHETITVEHGGQTLTLPLKTPKVLSGGSAPQMVPPAAAPMPNVSPAVLQTVVPNPTPADEQRRLEAVAAEVARRRALREQAAQQAQTGAAPAQANPTRGDMQQLQQQQMQQQMQRANGRRGMRTQ